MVSKSEVYKVADHLHGRGDRVSLRKVIPLLPWGGSNREVGPFLRDWKAERSYRPALESKDLPERVQRQLAKATATLWTVAQSEAAKILELEREALTAEKRAGDRILDEALARLDAAEAEAARLRDLLALLQPAALTASAHGLPTHSGVGISGAGARSDDAALAG